MGGRADHKRHVPKQEAIGVTANNVEYPKAYTRRTLAPGIGAENYKWEDFSEIKSIRELMDENTKLRNEITSMQGTPLGIVEMWAGSTVPNGYVLCDGRTMSTTEYPELFKALGTTFNTAISANGSKYTTPGGQFRVPDLRDVLWLDSMTVITTIRYPATVAV